MIWKTKTTRGPKARQICFDAMSNGEQARYGDPNDQIFKIT